MTRRAFTLIELLVVMAIMGMMGAISVGGYRAMRRGMEERSVRDNVNRFLHAAYQRAQIDRLPVVVYYWNELLREESEDSTIVVVGKAVAVRMSGRISKFDGTYLFDEYGLSKQAVDESDDGQGGESGGMYLYCLGTGGSVQKSEVRDVPVWRPFEQKLVMVEGDQTNGFGSYAYELKDGYKGWKVGDAYGFEFADITLPHGYIFGSSDGDYPKTMSKSVSETKSVLYSVDGSDSESVKLASLRPGKSGKIEAQTIGDSNAKERTTRQ